jgi:hypothetical protein
MRQAVYDALAALPGARASRVWPAGSVRTAFENAVAEAKLDQHDRALRPPRSRPPARRNGQDGTAGACADRRADHARNHT